MKKLILFLPLFLIACNGEQHSGNMPPARDTAVIRDTLPSSPVKEIPTPLAFIKHQVNYINTANLKKEHTEFTCDEKTSVDYYYDNNVPVKIVIDYGWVGDAHAKEEYYYRQGKLLFVYEFVEGGPACEGCIKTNEYRSYVSNDKVIKYLKNKHEAKCARCEFGQLSKPYKLLMTSTAEDAKKVLCK